MAPSRMPAAVRRRQLLDTALHVFAERGFHGTAMTDIADAAGVTKPVLYQHFGSKRDLYLQLLEDVGAHLRDAILGEVAAAPTAHRQVHAGFVAYFRFVAGNRSAFTLLFGSGARRDVVFADAVRRVEVALAEAIAGLIEAPIDDTHRRILAHGIVGLAEGTSRHWVAGDLDLDPDVLAHQVADLAWAGLRGIRPSGG